MSGSTDHTTHLSSSTTHQPKCVDSGAERTTDVHARDHPQTGITHAGDISPFKCSSPRKPNINKDLPDLPPVPTRLWGSGPALEPLRSEVVCPLKEVGSVVATSDVDSFAGLWFDFATYDEFSSEQTTLAQDDRSSEGCPSVDTSSEAWSLLPVTPTIRRFLAWELDIAPVSSVTKKVLNGVDQDGPFACPRKDCHHAFPTQEACSCHIHIHLLHERLRLCELCGTRFVDDDHKDEHLDSCPNLPTFHDLGSFNAEPEPAGHLQNLLNRLKL